MSFFQNKLIFSALLLTAVNFLCRAIGFFYRIFISQTLGEEAMGILQLLTPVLALFYALCCGGFQTCISRLSASCQFRERKSYPLLLVACTLSVITAILFSIAVYSYSDLLAEKILLEKRCAPLLRILTLSFPFSAFHSCVNGYLFAVKKSSLTAFLQLIEQIIRVSAIIFLCSWYINQSLNPPILVVSIGTAISELGSFIFSFFIILPKEEDFRLKISVSQILSISSEILPMIIPLGLSRVIVTFLQSAENIYIPEMLRFYGMTTKEALSIYGVLTGMALSVIFLPCSLVNSVALLLLPKVAEAQSQKRKEYISATIHKSLLFCIFFGTLCTIFFSLFGKELGKLLFHSVHAGVFIYELSFICPFLYISSALGAILHGLGKNYATLFINIAALSIRVLFVFCLIPKIGIHGYIWGLLLSQTVAALFCMIFLRQNNHIES